MLKNAILLGLLASLLSCKSTEKRRQKGQPSPAAQPLPETAAPVKTPAPTKKVVEVPVEPEEDKRLPEPTEVDEPGLVFVGRPQPDAFNRARNQNNFLPPEQILDIKQDKIVDNATGFGLRSAQRGINSNISPVTKFTVRHAGGTANVCTGAFISNEYMITAAHCFPMTDPITEVVISYGSGFSKTVNAKKIMLGLGADVALVKTPPVDPGMKYPKIQIPCPSTDYIDAAVTLHGRRDGVPEGQMDLTYFTEYTINDVIKTPLAQIGMTFVVEGPQTTQGTTGGDSGGPWIIGNTLIAVTGGSSSIYHSIGNRVCDGLIKENQ